MTKSKTKGTEEVTSSVPAVQTESKPLAKAGSVSMASVKQVSGQGTENIGMNDMSPPWFRILQALSAQIKKNKPEYVEGAQAGMFYNSATQQVFDGENGVLLVPVHYETRFLEYTPKTEKDQPQFVADHGVSGEVTKTLKKVKFSWITSEGNTITEVATYYALHYNPDTGSYNRIIMSMPSSQAKRARDWNGLIKNRKIPDPMGSDEEVTPPAYYGVYKSVVILTSKGDNDWFTYKITPYQDVLKPGDGEFVSNIKNGINVWNAAIEFYELINSGKITVEQPTDEDVHAASDGNASDAF